MPLLRMQQKYGFTLTELVIIMAIVIILGSMAITKYSGNIEKGRSAEAYAVLADIAAAQTTYYVEYGAYTTTWSLLDRFGNLPASDNFDFTQEDANLNSGYVKALHKTGKGAVDYYMCMAGGKKGTSALTCP